MELETLRKNTSKLFLWVFIINVFLEPSDFKNRRYLNKPNAERSGSWHLELETLRKKTCPKYFCRFCILIFFSGWFRISEPALPKHSGTLHLELETLRKKKPLKYFCGFCIIIFFFRSVPTFRPDFT